MSAVVEVREPSARYLEAKQPTSAGFHDLLIAAPGAVPRLRELISSLAVQGRLLPHAEASSSDLPANWTWKRLGDLVASSEAGWSPSCPEYPRRDGRWGVLKVSAVSWGVFDPLANKELPAGLDPRPQYEVMDGDFLLSRANTAELVARSVVVRNPPARLMLSDKIIRLRLREGVNADYVNLVNNGIAARGHYQTRASGTSTSMKNVSRDVVLALPVPLPPLAEQTRIVARVDELMRLCDALEAKGRLEAEQHARLLDTLLGTLTGSTTPEELAANWQRVANHFDLLLDRPGAVDALERTVLQLAVRGRLTSAKVGTDWTPTRLGDVVELLNGYAFKSEWFKDVGTRLVRNINVSHGHLDWSQAARVPASVCTEFAQFQLREGDVVLSLDRPIISTGLKLALIRASDLPCMLLQRVARLRPDKAALTRDYMVLWLESDVFVNSIDPGRSNGVPHISTKQVSALSLDLPPLAEQARIVTRVTELRRLCANLRARLTAQQTVQSRLADTLVEQALA